MILLTGASGMLGKEVLNHLKLSKEFSQDQILTPGRYELNLEDLSSTIKYFETHKPRVVIHLAAKVMGLQGNLQFQADSLVINSQINHNLFQAVFKFLPETFFFAGTAASYAYPYEQIPLKEKYFLNGDVHEGEFGYAWAKKFSYPWLRILRDEFSVKVVYGILTNLFGPNDRYRGTYTHVIPALINRAHENKRNGKDSLDVWGFPSVTRDFLYSSAAASIIVELIKPNTVINVPLFINIGSGAETQLRTVASVIANEFELSKVSWLHDKPTGVSRRYLDISNLKTLGIEVNSNLEMQLVETINWFKNNANKVR